MRSAYINDSAGPRLDEASERERGSRAIRMRPLPSFFLRAIAVKGRNHTHPNYGELKREEVGRREGAQHDEETSRVAWRRIPAASLHRGDRFFLGHA